MTKLGVAVVGVGIGWQHLRAWRALADRFEIVAVAEPDEQRREAAAAKFSPAHTVADLHDVLELPGVDVVDVCTPPDLHREMIRDALSAGRHVVCEKPLVGSLAECDQVASWEAASGRRVMPIFQYRFGNGLQRLRHLAERGVLGRAFLATSETSWTRTAQYYAVAWRGRWRTERGGALLSQAIHNHDIVSYIGGPVARVFAHTATRVNEIEVEDCAAASLRLADGSLATLSVTLGSAVEISRLRFCFEALTAESGLHPYFPSAEPWTFTPASPEAAARIDEALKDFQPGPELYEGQLARFHEAIVEGGELPVTVADARASLELVTALYKSAATGDAVELPISNEDAYYESWVPPEYRRDRP